MVTLLSRLCAVGLLLALPVALKAAEPNPAEAAILKRFQKLDAIANKDAAGHVTSIQFGCASAIRDDDVILLTAFPKLERLNIIGNDDVSDAGVEHLKGMKVKKLMIVSEKLTLKSAEHLATMTELEVLDLKAAPVDAEWLKQLKKLPNLHTLKLRGDNLKDADAKEFVGFPKLATLQFRNSNMTERGIESVKAALPKIEVTK